jgi:hypothetical protein
MDRGTALSLEWQGARDAGAARSGLNRRLRMNHETPSFWPPVPGEWCWSHEGEVRLGDLVGGALWLALVIIK